MIRSLLRNKKFLCAVFILAVGELVLASLHRPFETGDSKTFWLLVANVDLDSSQEESIVERIDTRLSYVDDSSDDFFFYDNPDDSFYYIVHKEGLLYIHGGPPISRVERYQVEQDLDAVVALLSKRPKSVPPTPVEAAFVSWREKFPHGESAETLIDEIRIFKDEEKLKNDTALYFYEQEIHEDLRWMRKRSRHLWLTVLFDFMVLLAIMVYAVVPRFKNYGPLRLAAHFALLPWLLFLPYLFGYAPSTFVTIEGGPEGVLYPWVIRTFFGWLPSNRWDLYLLNSVPGFFEPLSQSLGQLQTNVYFQGPGPIIIGAVGLVLGTVIVFLKCRLSKKADMNTEKNG